MQSVQGLLTNIVAIYIKAMPSHNTVYDVLECAPTQAYKQQQQQQQVRRTARAHFTV